jgi:hypothetical protein
VLYREESKTGNSSSQKNDHTTHQQEPSQVKEKNKTPRKGVQDKRRITTTRHTSIAWHNFFNFSSLASFWSQGKKRGVHTYYRQRVEMQCLKYT